MNLLNVICYVTISETKFSNLTITVFYCLTLNLARSLPLEEIMTRLGNK